MGPPKREAAGGAPTEYQQHVDPISGQHPVAYEHMQHQAAAPEPPAVLDHQHLHQQAPPPPLPAHNMADHGNYNNYQQQQQAHPPHNNMGGQVNYNYQQQSSEPPAVVQFPPPSPSNYQQQSSQPPAVVQFPPPSPNNYQQQSSQPPAVVQFPPPSPNNNMPHQHQQQAPAAFPPANNNNMNNNDVFPPQNGYAHQQQQYGNGYNTVNMNNNGMPPASPHKAVYHHAPPPVNGIPMAAAGTPVSAWKTGLFDCMDDPMNAIITAFFPCLTFGQVAEIVDSGHTSCGTSGMLYGLVGYLLGVPFIMSCTYRTKLRNMFGLAESPAPDWVTHFLCEWCALCQEYRELQLRGYDPSIGWLGNQALRQHQQQQVIMAPPMNQRMMA